LPPLGVASRVTGLIRASTVGPDSLMRHVRFLTGEHHSGLRAAFALTVAPAAMGLGTHSGWGGVSRRLTTSTSGTSEGGVAASTAPHKSTTEISKRTDQGLMVQGQGGLWPEIAKCADARKLMELVQPNEQGFKVRHVLVAWTTVAGMPGAGGEGGEEVALQELQVLTRAKVHEMGARGLAHVAHSMGMVHASGRMGVDDELMRELQARAMATVGTFKLQHVSMFMLALARMGIKNPDAGLVEAMQARAMLKAGVYKYGGFKPVGITNLMHAFATMGIMPDAGLLELMQGRAVEMADDFTPEEAETLLQALSTLGITPDAGLVEAMQAQATAAAGNV